MIAVPKSPEISVIICTRNRAMQLGEVLDSAVHLEAPSGCAWELLVVDNGSSDRTDEVAASYQDRLPLRVIREERAGLSNARNRGLQEAAGTYICWTDDDVLLDPNWLAAYAAAFNRHPDAAIFAGRVSPVLATPTPAWFQRVSDKWPLTNVLAKRDFGAQPLPLDFARGIIPWGANYAIRTAEQLEVLYDPGLGVSPHHRRVGEESEVIFRLLSKGATGWWVPEAGVRHLIPLQRQSWAYVLDYACAAGETLAYMQHEWPDAHHMSSDRRTLDRISRPAAELDARAKLYRKLSTIARRVGATQRGVQWLATSGLYEGASRFGKSRA
jgi:hypothetical protein